MIKDTSSQDRVVTSNPSNRRWATGLVLIAVTVIGIWTLKPRLERLFSAGRSFEKAKLHVAVVEQGDLVRQVSVDGRVVAGSYPKLFSPAQGIVNLKVRAGDTVKANQVIATIESPELASRSNQEKTTLDVLKSNLERKKIERRTILLQKRQEVDRYTLEKEAADREAVRLKKVFDQGLVNEIEYEIALDNAKLAALNLRHASQEIQLLEDRMDFEVRDQQLQVERQEFVLREMERQLNQLTVTSPVNGLVGNVEIQDQDAVSAQQALVTVVDLTSLEVEVDIPENYADEIQPGFKTEIVYEGEKYTGRIATISPEVVGNLVKARVLFNDKVPMTLKQNQRVTAEIVLDRKSDVLKVRRGPFLESGAGSVVYVVENGMAVRRKIQVGGSSISEVEIRTGLEAGENIVISDISRFENAERIILR